MFRKIDKINGLNVIVSNMARLKFVLKFNLQRKKNAYKNESKRTEIIQKFVNY